MDALLFGTLVIIAVLAVFMIIAWIDYKKAIRDFEDFELPM